MSELFLLPQSQLSIGGGGLVAPRSGGDFDYLPMAYEANMRKVYGRLPGMLDKAALAAREDGTFLDWSPIDREYDHRELTSLGTVMTAQAANEMAGMPFVMLASQIIITHEKNWTVVKRERIMDGYVNVGPTGIPRSSSFMTRSISGNITRYKHWHQMPNEKLADPNFGLDNYLDMLEDFKAQLNHTIMIQVATEIASRDHRNRIENAEAIGRDYTYLDHYRDTTEHFCYGAINPEAFTRALQMNMTRVPRMNTVILADINQGSFKDNIIENRAFLGHIRDDTPTTKALAEQLDNLRSDPVGVLAPGIGSPSEDNILLTIPTFHAHSDEPVQYGYQPLEREILLGGAYCFPNPDYATADGLSAHSTATSVLAMESNHARWRRIRLSNALRATNGGFVFANSGPSAGPSARVQTLLDKWNEPASDFENFYGQHIAGARDRDTPSPWAKEASRSASRLSDIHGFRDFPWCFHPLLVPEDVTALDDAWRLVRSDNKVGFVRYLGQFTEDVLPISHLAAIIGTIHRDLARGLGVMTSAIAGPEADAETKLIAPLLSRILGIPTAQCIKALEITAASDGWAGDKSSIRQIAWLADRMMDIITESTSTSTRGQPRPRAPRADPRAGAEPAPRPAGLRSIAQEFMQSIPDDSFDAFAPIAPVLEEINKEQSREVGDILTKVRAFANDYKGNSVLHRLALEGILSKLNAMGIRADTDLLAPMPTLSKPAMASLRKHKPDAELQSTGTATAPSTFTKAALFGSESSTRHIGSATESVGYPRINTNDTVEVFTVDDPEDFAVDFSHFAVLPEILAGMMPIDAAILFLLMSLPFDVPTLVRLDEMGIQILNSSVERVGQRLRANSAIVMRRGTETLDWMMSPIRTEVTCQGVVGITDFVVALGMGPRWKGQDNVKEIYGIFPSGVQQGWGTEFMENIEELVAYCSGGSTSDPATNDCFLNLYPITEKNRRFPGNLLGGPTITDRERHKNNRTPMFHNNSGHSFFRQLMTGEEIEEIEHQLNAAAEGLWNGSGRAIQPIIEKMGHYQPTVKGKFSIQDPGTGPMGSMMINNINCMANILNGMGGQFGAEPPAVVSVS